MVRRVDCVTGDNIPFTDIQGESKSDFGKVDQNVCCLFCFGRIQIIYKINPRNQRRLLVRGALRLFSLELCWLAAFDKIARREIESDDG